MKKKENGKASKSKNQKQEEKIDLGFKVVKKGKTEKAYSVFDEKSKKYKKKDVVINAIKTKKRHTFLTILVILVILSTIILCIPKENKEVEKEKVIQDIEQNEADDNIIVENDKTQEVDLDSKEAQNLNEFIKGTMVDEEYDDVSQISNENKIKIAVNKTKLKPGYIDIAGEEVLGVNAEEVENKAKEIFGEEVEFINDTTKKYSYNQDTDTYTKIADEYKGYRDIEIITSCKKKENIYTVNLAYAQGYLTDHTYIISGKQEEITLDISTDAITDDEQLSLQLKEYIEKLDKYECNIMKNTDGTYKLISLRKI